MARIDQLDRTKNWALLPFYMTCAAELQGQHGDPAAAVALLQRATEIANATGSRWCNAEIMRLQARFGATDPQEAVRLLNASLATAKEQARLWELRTAVTLAKLLREQGDHAPTREVLQPIYDSFGEGWDTADLVAARALLA